MKACATVAMVLLSGALVAPADDWCQWRGASRTGVVKDSPPLIASIASNQLPLAWEAPLPQGTYRRAYYSSPVAAKGRAYLHLSPGTDPAPPPAPPAKPQAKKADDLDDALAAGAKGDRAVTDDAAMADLEKSAARAEAARAAEAAAQKRSNEAEDMLLCFDLATGREEWRFQRPGGPTGIGAPNSPCISDGRAYFVGVLGRLYCVDAATGQARWQVETAAAGDRGQYSSSPLVADGMVVVANGKMRAYHAADGKKAWEAAVNAECSSPAVWRWGGRTFVIQIGADIVCVDVKTGEVQWKAPGGESRASVVVSDDYLVSFAQVATPQIYRLRSDAAEPVDELKIKPAGMGHQACTPSVEGKRLYFWDSATTYCYDMERKSMVWTGEGPRDGKPSPIVADGKVIGNSRGKVLVLDANSGATLISASVPVADCTSCALTDGRLLVNAGTHLRCYDLRKHSER
jgi:outer membrane protein assembly factor BamB